MQNRTNAKEFFINLLKFALTSTAGTTVDLGLHWILSKFVFDGNYWGTFWVAPTISFEMSTIVNYFIAFFFIWKDRITERTPRSFFHHLLGYNAACIGAYLIKLGLMQGLQLDDSRRTGEVCAAALEEGLIVISAGENVLRLVPPLVIGREDIDEMAEKLDRVLG